MSDVPRFTVTICSTDDDVTLCCAGEIDLSYAHLLRQPLEAHLDEMRRELTVDLREVLYLDSAAVKELLRGALLRTHRGRQLRVRVTARQRRWFILSHTDRLLILEAAGAATEPEPG